jgi:hypothetical protein
MRNQEGKGNSRGLHILVIVNYRQCLLLKIDYSLMEITAPN